MKLGAIRDEPVSKLSVSANFLHALLAVVAGNAAYFLLVPYLPAGARHSIFQLDWGLVVDFWFCLVAFGAIKTVARWRTRE